MHSDLLPSKFNTVSVINTGLSIVYLHLIVVIQTTLSIELDIKLLIIMQENKICPLLKCSYRFSFD